MPSSAPRHGAAGHALLAALVARGQDGGGDAPGAQDQDQDQISRAMAALLAAVVAVFVFIASATIYLRHCSGGAPPPRDSRAAAGHGGAFSASRSSWSWWQHPRRRTPRGLDAGAVEAFPTMTYAEAKALRVGNGGALDCAVCLSEFEDGERLRLLLPRCSHAFHPDCIGAWLAGHVTCPVCRCNLEPSSHKDATSSSDGEPTGSFPPIPVASSNKDLVSYGVGTHSKS